MKRNSKVPKIQGYILVVGSMDVGASYPNCKQVKSGKSIDNASKLCGTSFENNGKPFLAKLTSIVTRGKSGNKQINELLQIP